MTEAEWLTCDDPWESVPFIACKASRRKLLLFEVACCRRAWCLMLDSHRVAVVAAERLADGFLTLEQFQSLFDPVMSLWRNIPPATVSVWEPSHFLTGAVRHLGSTGVDAASYAARALACQDSPVREVGYSVVPRADEVTRQVHLLRDIFGNPFRPVNFSPEWRTSTVLAIAQGMYDSRDFSAMPILGDALQDAGCENADILSHCRDQQATHVRGCWAVDLVLDKS